MELRSNIKMLNYARKFLLNDTDNILPFAVRPQKPVRTGKLPQPLPRATPQECGIPAGALDTLLRGLAEPSCGTHSCMVLRYGKVVCECGFAPYTTKYWHVTHSMCKSVTGTAIGMLIDEGKLSPDEHICDIFPERCGLLTSRRMRAITVRHLLTMTSGVSFREAGIVTDNDWIRGYFDSDVLFDPGTEFDYNSMNTYLLSAIVKVRAGVGLAEYLRPRLFEPLGFGDIAWETCPMGIEKGGWGLYIHLEDIAKLGQLYLQNGVWTGANGQKRRILSEQWVKDATSVHSVRDDNEEYGYQLWPNSHDHLYMFNGMFGQYVVVVPGLDLVVAINSGAGHLFTESSSYTSVQKFMRQVAESSGVLPEDPDADERLAFTLSHLRFGQAVPEMPAPPAPQPWYIRLFRFFFPEKQPLPAPCVPDEVLPALSGIYKMEPSRAGMIPSIIACMNDWYTGGVEQIRFEASERSLTVLWTENGTEQRIFVGFDVPLESEINLGGNRFIVGTTGRFTQNEDDVPVLKLTVCLLESSSSRLLKLIFEPDHTLTVKFDESPSLALAMASLQQSSRQLSQRMELFRDMNYLQYLEERLCRPVVYSIPPEETQQ